VAPTLWESPNTLGEFKKAGIATFVKVPATKDNEALFKKYGAGAGTLVICAPNGDKLCGFSGEECTVANVTKELKSFKDRLAAWHKSQEKKPAK
jgi:hypothetical protein